VAARQYSNKATPATLGGGISSSDTALSLSTVSGLPASFPYTLVIEPDSVNAEVVSCTALAGTIATVTRGQDGTTAVAHSAGAAVYHDHTARDFQEPQDHIAATTGHGATGAVVGTTNSQTLTNKTVALGSNTVSGTLAQLNTAVTDADVASLAGAETLTNKTVALGSNTVSGTTAQFNTANTDNDFATLAGSETLTNKTLTTPTINSPSIATPTVTGTATTAQVDATTLTASVHVQSPETTGGSSRTAAPYAVVPHLGATIATGTVTQLFFSGTATEESDAALGTSDGFTIGVAGVYDFMCQVETDEAGAYGVRVGIRKGATFGASTYVALNKLSAVGGVFGSYQAVALGVRCAASDKIWFDIWHNNGGSFHTTAVVNAAGSYATAEWRRP
jgi:hypothetical protein